MKKDKLTCKSIWDSDALDEKKALLLKSGRLPIHFMTWEWDELPKNIQDKIRYYYNHGEK